MSARPSCNGAAPTRCASTARAAARRGATSQPARPRGRLDSVTLGTPQWHPGGLSVPDLQVSPARRGERVFYNGLGSTSLGLDARWTARPARLQRERRRPERTYTLPSSGTYILTIYGSGASSAAYSFNLLNAALPVAPLTRARRQRHAGQLGRRGRHNLHRTAGERLFYNATVTAAVSCFSQVRRASRC